MQLAQARLGSGLTGFEVMGQFALALVASTFRSCACRCPQAPLLRAAGEIRQESRGACARAVRAPAGSRAGRGCVTDAVVAENHRAGAPAVAHPRDHPAGAGRGRPEHQARHLDAGLAHPGVLRRDRCRCCSGEIPGVRLVNFGHLGDGNLHYNVQAPEGGDTRGLPARARGAVNTLVYDPVQRFGGSISARARHRRAEGRQAAALQVAGGAAMMRAIKKALDPQEHH